MSLLTQSLPKEAVIGGEHYPLNTDFRVGLRILEAYEDETLTPFERQVILLQMLYTRLPEQEEDLRQAVKLGVDFLNCGQVHTAPTGRRMYSFTRDAAHIYSGILHTHGVDLSCQQLHWWTFCAMFRELGQDCVFTRLLTLRQRVLGGKLTTEERRVVAALGEDALPPCEESSPQCGKQIQQFYDLLQNNADKILGEEE
ncbi:MAG: Gp15 family bacteriophage protein [Angelakisella sp.]|nr:Gp15 family bacteriophage protein [Angelakisella sp.]